MKTTKSDKPRPYIFWTVADLEDDDNKVRITGDLTVAVPEWCFVPRNARTYWRPTAPSRYRPGPASPHIIQAGAEFTAADELERLARASGLARGPEISISIISADLLHAHEQHVQLAGPPPTRHDLYLP